MKTRRIKSFKCPHCGSPDTRVGNFNELKCLSCGHIEPEAIKGCPYCGSVLYEDQGCLKICYRCGYYDYAC